MVRQQCLNRSGFGIFLTSQGPKPDSTRSPSPSKCSRTLRDTNSSSGLRILSQYVEVKYSGETCRLQPLAHNRERHFQGVFSRSGLQLPVCDTYRAIQVFQSAFRQSQPALYLLLQKSS